MNAAPVYVLLVNYNGWRDTLECLESLMRSDYPDVRVLLLDNGSTDDSMRRIESWAQGLEHASPKSAALEQMSTPPVPKPIAVCRLTRDEAERGSRIDWSRTKLVLIDCAANLGFARANNVGLRYALKQEENAVVLLLNNDTVIAPDAISAMVATAGADSRVGGVGATILQYHAPERVETYAGATVITWTAMSRLIGTNAQRSAPRDAPAMDFISGCCMLVTRAAIERVGFIDERFFLYCEDADWGVRARLAGLKLAHSRSAEVWHKGGATAVHRSAFHDYHNSKSVLHFVRKHRPLFLPIAAVYLAARFSAPKLVRGEWRRLRAVWRGFADFVKERNTRTAAGPREVSTVARV